MSVSFEADRPLLLFESRASLTVDGIAVGAGRFCPAVWGGVWAFCERVVRVEDCCCWCWDRSAFALRRASSMRRTCSGVIAVLVDGALGGVVGRSMPAMVVDFVLMDQAVESIVYS